MADHIPPIGYRSKEPPSGGPLLAMVALLFGLFCGVVFIAVCGGVMSTVADAAHPLQMSFRYWPGALCFFALAVGSGVGGVFFLVSRHRHMFLAGIMLGAAVMSLLEGTCFYSYSKI
jgi:hypothetical protein